jgi:signal transduction histidine kinase
VSVEAVRAVWSDPRAADAEGPRRRDWVLVAVVVVAACVETVVRDDLVWRVPSLVVALAGAAVLPWRRVQPFAATAVAVGLASVVELAALDADVRWDGLGTAIFFLLLPYSLGRWGSGREVIGGAAVFAVILTLTAVAGDPAADVIGGIAIISLVGAVGAVVRYRQLTHRQELDGVRSSERAELARELHDSVAHHVSAIAIQAQAGQVLAATDPAAAAEALAVIEEQASRTLEEMRSMVGALRDTDRADLAPQQGVHDIHRLADRDGAAPVVAVELRGSLDDLRPSVDAALYRMAQEAITNARRHARHATSVDVCVVGGAEDVRLTVVDDGEGGSAGAPGFGLTGMAERTRLLGGTFAAGPGDGGGWTVCAVLPRQGPAA